MQHLSRTTHLIFSDFIFSHLRKASSLAFQEVVGLGREDLAVETRPLEGLSGDGSSGLVIHGLLGAGRNWRTISQSLAMKAAKKSKKDWRLILVDLRNHGASAAVDFFQPPHSIQSTAQDLIHLYEHHNKDWPRMVTGHSLGGKVALEYVRLLSQDPEADRKLPKEVWILDSQLGPISTTLQSASKVDYVFDTIQSIPLPIPSRKWLYSYVRSERGHSLEVAHWLGSNLEGHPKGPLKWMFNVHGAAEMYSSYKSLDCWDVVKNPPEGTNINIVRAEKSDRWNQELINELHLNLKESKTKVHVLENCGHWLHADNPSGKLFEFLKLNVANINLSTSQ